MVRLHTLGALAWLALVAGCAGTRPQGALSPLGSRVTNEVLSEDALVFTDWQRRVAAVRQPSGRDAGPRAYAAARAAAWLAYARDSYAWDPRDATADRALGETRRLVLALERDSTPELGGLPMTADLRARPDLWTALERARAGAALRESPAAVADAEVALVRASRLASGAAAEAATRPMTDYERACELQLQVATAERLIAGLGPVQPAATVALQGAPAPAVVPAPVPTVVPMPATPVAPVAPGARPLQRVVHFAVNSSELALKSRMTLGEVTAILRAHPKVNLVIEGFTDPRGSERYNRELAVRRADAVRRFLDAAELDLGRVMIAGVGPDSVARRRVSPTADMLARDRRVTLAFTGPDGRPLTVAAYHMLDVDHERDLQVEQDKRRRARASQLTTGGASRLPRTPRDP